MKKLISIACAILCIFTLASCAKHNEATGTTGVYMGEPIELTDEIRETIYSLKGATSWQMLSSSTMQYTENEAEEPSGGYMIGFDGSMITDENGVRLYHGNTIAMNSALAFTLEYEKYYSDGWIYQIYHDPQYEEANTYERYRYTEQEFLSDYNGIVPTLVSEEEMDEAEAYSKDGMIIVCVTPDAEGRALEELLGTDPELISTNHGISLDEIQVSNAAITYGIKDGKLVSYIGSFTLQFYAGDIYYEYSMEKMCEISAINEGVEPFTLPENADEFELMYDEE